MTCKQHYDHRPFATGRLLEPGEHRVEVRAYYQYKGDKSCLPLFKRRDQHELIVEVLD
jgi:hypothetical protein